MNDRPADDGVNPSSSGDTGAMLPQTGTEQSAALMVALALLALGGLLLVGTRRMRSMR